MSLEAFGATACFTDYTGNLPRSNKELADWHRGVPQDAVLDPRMPIVDAHHHLFGSLQDRLFYRLEDLHQDIDCGHRVIGSVYVEAYESGWRSAGPESLRPVGEVEKIEQITRWPDAPSDDSCRVAAGIVSYADLTLGHAVGEVLDQQIAAGEGRLRGVRYRTATDTGTVGKLIDHPPRPRLLGETAFRQGFSELAPRGLSFDAWVYHTQLRELLELADTFPQTTIVLNHVGGPIGVAEYRSKRDEVLGQWTRGMRDLAARPNIRVKIGGMGMAVFGFGFERKDRPAKSSELVAAWRPSIETCIGLFGTERCMFESNFPVDKQTCSYAELWNAFKACTQGLAFEHRQNLFYRTACQTYRLTELEQLGNRLCT
ncbi:amidohydrolase family protein [Paraburkholderia sp. SIMBA_053]|uniref:amidohydrolase family protein n=1 Tax=Paraburkholderia sp. SIMBA_053 TaxID=3085794 RepID=UPI00397E2A72